MSNYLLFKVSALEHVSSNSACRIAEDILTIICDDPGAVVVASPTPTQTSTPTPTPTPIGIFDTSITIAGTNSSISSYSTNGLTLTSVGGAIIYFNKQPLSSTIGIMSIRKGTIGSSIELARIVFVDTYLNTKFKFVLNDVVYSGLFTNNSLYFA